MAIVFVPRVMCNAYNEGAEKGELIMKEKLKTEVLSLALYILINVELTLLVFVSFGIYGDYLWGSIYILALIVTTTFSICERRYIDKIIDDGLISIETIE